MLLFHAVFASAAAATSASLSSACWVMSGSEKWIYLSPKKIHYLLCLFGNIVDIIILGYNYHLFSSADSFFKFHVTQRFLLCCSPFYFSYYIS